MGKYYVKKDNKKRIPRYPGEITYIKEYLEKDGAVLCNDMKLEELFIEFSMEKYNRMYAPIYNNIIILNEFSEWLLNKD